MRRITTIILLTVLLTALASCTGEKNPATEGQETEKAQVTQETKESQDNTMTSEFDFEKKTVMLNSGYEMPIIGLGTWTLSDSFDNDEIVKIANEHGVTSAQVILRWQIQDGYIAIPGSSNAEHIAENYDIFGFELSEEEMQQVRAIDEQRRYENW